MRPQDPVQHRVSYSEILVGSVELILESTSLYFQGKPHLSFRVARREAHLSVVSVYRLTKTGSSRRGGVLRAKLFTKRTDSVRITIVNCRVKVADQQIAGKYLASHVSINQQLSRHNVSTFEAASNSCPRHPTFR